MPTIRYAGGGDYWPGVPARDLDAEEWVALPEDLRRLLLALRLYEIIAEPPRTGRSRKEE